MASVLQVHPVAEMFPLIEGDDYQSLVEDVKRHGVREPVWLHPDGSIIDGRNRARAAADAGAHLPTRTWDGTGSLVEFVLSLNLHRRHLTSSQKAVLADSIEPMLAAEAKKRQRQGGEISQQGSQIVDYPDSSNEGKAAQQAAKLVGTNRQYVADVKKIRQAGRTDIIAQIQSGSLTVPQAKRELANADGAGDEWYTPKWLFDGLGVTFDIDTCSPADRTHVSVPAQRWFTIEDDGLAQDWTGIVWCNPPYSTPNDWAMKMIEHGNGLLLTHIPMNAEWATSVWQAADGIRLFQAMEFVRPDGAKQRPGYWLMLAAFGQQATEALERLHVPPDVAENPRRVPSPMWVQA
jgi:hypothetical protein